MAQDRTYEMGCDCPKKLCWCDGECETPNNTVPQTKVGWASIILSILFILFGLFCLFYLIYFY